MISGSAGMLLAVGLCSAINLLPMPTRFAGMIISWQIAVLSLGMLVAVGVVTSTYPARRAAELPPVEALRFEM
jgi:putative ABC transport system permease protein